ncbi:hypothetical protein ACL02S_10250 [Nocardia sp. 004]|uniref:hypothetical protein n=1 Tax=Nocardia sp. 004 TaxID=3385978 RepID=UPI0039A0C5CD
MIVDWQVYYDAAEKCHDLAADLRRADKPVHDAVKRECAGMAGDAPGCRQWGETYDRIAHDTMQSCTNLADALTNYGYVLYASGYNYAVGNRCNPLPPRPDVRAMTEHKVTIPTSVHDNGTGVHHGGGVEEFFSLLVAKIVDEFGKLPNGDVDKLAEAARTWETFAANDTITGAAARINAIAAMFDGMDDPLNRQLIQDQFAILRTSADQVATAAVNVAAPVADYHSGTVDVGRGIQSAITTAEWAIGLTVAAAVAAALLTFGGSLAAGAGGVAVAVGETAMTIRSLYQASNLIRVVGLTVAAAGAVGVISAFDKVPDLGATITSLAGIIAMRVHIDDDDDTNDGGGSGRDSGTAQTAQQKAAAVKDVVTDDSGALIGTEDAAGVQMVSQEQVDKARAELTEKLGPPRVNSTPKGDIEVWEISSDPKSTVTYRPFSQSGGATIDYNNVPGVDIKRWHIPQ